MSCFLTANKRIHEIKNYNSELILQTLTSNKFDIFKKHNKQAS